MFTLSQHPKIMHFTKSLSQLGLLVVLWWIGAFIQKFFNLPISAGVIGLLLLLAALMSGIFKLSWIKQGSDLILAELVLFFIPCVVGIVKYEHLLLTRGMQLIIAVVLGTICVMVVTAYMVHIGFRLEAHLKNKNLAQKNHGSNQKRMQVK